MWDMGKGTFLVAGNNGNVIWKFLNECGPGTCATSSPIID